MISSEALAILEEEQVLLAHGFEDAFLGVSSCPGRPVLAVYDVEKCLDILVERDGMGPEEAREYFDFNVMGSWGGEGTPVFLERLPGADGGTE